MDWLCDVFDVTFELRNVQLDSGVLRELQEADIAAWLRDLNHVNPAHICDGHRF